MVSLFKKKKVAPPYEPTKLRPHWPGAWQFTLRSTPRHHDGILAQIESNGGAHVYFSEPLAYLRGQGVSIFRVEARDLNFLDNLYRWWAETERAEAAQFNVGLFFNNTDFVADLKSHSPADIQRLIEQDAPRVPDDLDDATQQRTTKARV
jgi:hypothetical protein